MPRFTAAQKQEVAKNRQIVNTDMILYVAYTGIYAYAMLTLKNGGHDIYNLMTE